MIKVKGKVTHTHILRPQESTGTVPLCFVVMKRYFRVSLGRLAELTPSPPLLAKAAAPLFKFNVLLKGDLTCLFYGCLPSSPSLSLPVKKPAAPKITNLKKTSSLPQKQTTEALVFNYKLKSNI